jgi:hypothetical protein
MEYEVNNLPNYIDLISKKDSNKDLDTFESKDALFNYL